MIKKAIMIFLTFGSLLFATDHGIYLQTLSNVKAGVDETGTAIVQKLSDAGFDIIAYRDVQTPDIVREEANERCGFKVKQIVFSSDDYLAFLAGYDKKYIVAGFLKVAIYETENGVQVNITDPETINRIVFNDLWEDEKEDLYNKAIADTKIFKKKIVDAIHSTGMGKAVNIPMEPIRDNEDLAESSRDMFMMVGPLTLFTDEDQFPVIYEIPASNPKSDIQNLISEMRGNLSAFQPTQDDIEYRYTKSPEVLKWEIIGELYSPDSTAVVLGITRQRTEGLSFHIAGASRESDINKCPGIDHAAAYPIETLIRESEGKILVQTQVEMSRMDMYFWDAGMMAFTNHMSMPGLLDESIIKALLGKKANND